MSHSSPLSLLILIELKKWLHLLCQSVMASVIQIFLIKFADMPEFCFIISLTMTLMTDCFVYDESRFTGKSMLDTFNALES